MTRCEAHEDCYREATERVQWGEWNGDDREQQEERQCTPCATQMERGHGTVDVVRKQLPNQKSTED